MNSPIRFRVDGSDGVRVTVGPVWAELNRAEALEMWRALGQELGMMCDSHRLTGKVVPASTCSRCEQLIAVVDNS